MPLAALILLALIQPALPALPKPAATQVQPAAQSPSVASLFDDFGLFGEWAVDCAAKASPGNPHVRILHDPAGTVFEKDDLGARYTENAYRIEKAERLSPTRLQVEAEFRPESAAGERQELVFSVRDRTRRTLFTRVSGGPVRVKNGVAVGYGVKTPRLNKCG